MKSIKNKGVAAVFASYPPAFRRKLLAIRKIILDTAKSTEGVGPIEETLKWGQPAYLTPVSKSGSTIRVDWTKSKPHQYAVYFNCRTTLIESLRARFPETFTFEGNRKIIFEKDDPLPVNELMFCVAEALTHHLNK